MVKVKGIKFFKHQRFLNKWARGFWERHGRCYRFAVKKVTKAWQLAVRGRHVGRRNVRHIWKARIGAASAEHDITYSRFVGSLKRDNILLNKKMMADFALNEPYTFRELSEHAKYCCLLYHIPPSHYFIPKNY